MEKMKSFFDNLAPEWINSRSNEQIENIYSLINKLPINKGDAILDVACGAGIVTSALENISCSKTIGIDISSEMIKYAKQLNTNINVNFLTANFYEFSYECKFDKIVVFDAYPHFIERDLFKKSVLENLNKNGELIILHDLSRHELDHCHSGNQVNKLSRSINSPIEEYEFYKNEFDLINAYEDEKSYLLIIKKK